MNLSTNVPDLAPLEQMSSLCVNTVAVDATSLANPSSVDSSLRNLRAFAGAARARQLNVELLAGDPGWVSEPRGSLAVLDLANELAGEGLPISAIHFDVEPWGDAAWPEARAELSVAYISWAALMLQRSHLPVAFDVPYWWDGHGGGAPEVSFRGAVGTPWGHMLRLMAHKDGYLSPMAYRDNWWGENGVVENARRLGESGRVAGVKVVVAVEIGPSHCLTTPAACVRDAADLPGTADVDGVAVHDLVSLAALGALS